MRTAHVVSTAVLVAGFAVVGCNRPDTRDNARAAAAEVKDAAGRAGEKLADSWLATKIHAQYFADGDVKARNILVSARDGVVTLKGRVETERAHDQALRIAQNTDGVSQVNDQLTLGAGPAASPGQPTASRPSASAVATTGAASIALPPLEERLNDAGITASIQSRYFLDSNIKARRIEVDTRGGVVTLRGEVVSDDERAQALILARTTEGVARVEDGLTVNLAAQSAPAAQGATTAPALPSAAPSVSSPAPSSAPSSAAPAAAAVQAQDAALATELESKFAADRQVKGAAIGVTAKDGVVLLEGTAPTAAAKQRALTLVRETKGVVQVVDRMTVRKAR